MAQTVKFCIERESSFMKWQQMKGAKATIFFRTSATRRYALSDNLETKKDQPRLC